MELLIESLTGSKLQLKVSPSETIISVKSKIQRLEGIPVSQQHLVFRSQELDDDSTLQDYNITEGSTLKLVIAMRGGPINTRRVPLEDSTWKEITDYMEANRGEILEKFPGGRHVTLLLYRDGDQINYFRVLDRGDGTVAPVSESIGKLEVAIESDTVEQQRLRENDATMKKMKHIRKQMEALSLKKPKQIATTESSPNLSVPSTSSSAVQQKKSQSSPTLPSRQLKLTSGGSTFRPSLVARPPLRPSSSLHQLGQGERQRGRGKSVIRVITRRKANGAQSEDLGQHPQSRDDSVVENASVVRLTAVSLIDKNELANRKPVSQLAANDVVRVETSFVEKDVDKELEVKNGQCSSGTILVESSNSNGYSANSKGNTSVSVRTLANELTPSYDSPTRHVHRNSQLSRIQTDVDHIEQLQETLARFDPRISSVQPAARSRHPSAVNNRTILESMGYISFPSGQNLLGVDIASSGPKSSLEIAEYNDTTGPTSHTAGLIATTKLKAMPASTFMRSEKKTEKDGSPTQPDVCEGMVAQPISVKVDDNRSEVTRVVQLPLIKTINKHRKERCQVCHHKTGLANSYVCRCGRNFCAAHRYAETHDCTYDYKTEGRRILEKNNPQVTAPKLPKI